MHKVAVLLSGCGVFDGSEINESVLTFLALSRLGIEYTAVSLDKNQSEVVDHLKGQKSKTDAQRNVLIESARLARGQIKDITHIATDEYDALVIPGGFGVAKNFSDFAVNDKDYTVDKNIVQFVKNFKNKPVGFICIAPIIAPFVYTDVSITVGDDACGVATILKEKGVHHVAKRVDEVCVDEHNRVLSTPAYMLGTSVFDVWKGIEKLVKRMAEMMGMKVSS